MELASSCYQRLVFDNSKNNDNNDDINNNQKKLLKVTFVCLHTTSRGKLEGDEIHNDINTINNKIYLSDIS